MTFPHSEFPAQECILGLTPQFKEILRQGTSNGPSECNEPILYGIDWK